MGKLGVSSKVDQPTEWCSYMVVVPKGNDKVRICIDPLGLNENIIREAYLLLSVDQILAQLSGSKVFTKLDCNLGFWQIPLTKESSLLTTFITLFKSIVTMYYLLASHQPLNIIRKS